MRILKKIFQKTGQPPGVSKSQNYSYPFKFEVVKGSAAIERLFELRKNSDFYPVILGEPKSASELIQGVEGSRGEYSAILEESIKIDPLVWLKTRKKENEEAYELEKGAWPAENISKNDFSLHRNILTRKPFEEVIIGLFKVSESAELINTFGYGGWNECSKPVEHIALLRYWNERYRAEIACMSSDILEFTVDNPPSSKEEALELAFQQFIYCPDIVLQGTDTIEKLAALLLSSRVWYFWWD